MVESNKIFFPYDENDSRTSREYDLDNHFYSLFTENGCHFKTNEHYFQSKKFHDPEIKQLIINSETPELAKSIGLQHKINIAEWLLKRVQAMKDGLFLKFSQNEDLKAKLLSTGDSVLAEVSSTDFYWGGSEPGSENVLGRLLMEVRDSLR